MTSKEQVEENFQDYNEKIPYSFWEFLKENKLIDPRAPIE